MKTNIVVLSTADRSKKKFARQLSDFLNMYYVDVQELLNYDISCFFDRIDEVGEEYLKRITNKKIKTVSGYENAVITLEPETVFDNDNISLFKKNSWIVHVVLKDLLNKKITNLVTEERNRMYEGIADISIDCSLLTIREAAKEVIMHLEKLK